MLYMCYFVSLDCRASQWKYLNPLLNVVQLSDSTLLQFSLVAFPLSLTLKFLLHFSFACESLFRHPCQACFYVPFIISFVFLT